MSLNNRRNCNNSAISCLVPGSISVPFPGTAPSPTPVATPRLFFTPLPPNPDPIELPENTNNITIMEFLVPAQAVAGGTARVQLDSTISTEVFFEAEVDIFLNIQDIAYQLFRNDVLLTDTIVSGNYLTAADMELNTLYTFNSTFTWVDTLFPTDPIFPTDPVRYRIVANVGEYGGGAFGAQVRNRGFVGVVYPTDPIQHSINT
ncbi:hypothetical protein [Bacillus pseudomycoides]|uniref:hypothetical protein n=1 Tax=Bacillus pseudomycoides TaxID=64104 RepID=UPI00211D70BC|nr:hypothetical protein [Bacillus pseudomycoides]